MFERTPISRIFFFFLVSLGLSYLTEKGQRVRERIVGKRTGAEGGECTLLHLTAQRNTLQTGGEAESHYCQLFLSQ